MGHKWFFVFNENSTAWFNQLLRRSVASAIRFNPHLSAHCIYDGGDTFLTNWMESKGVHIHKAAVPFKDRLYAEETLDAQAGQNPAYRPEVASGAYLKLLIPDFCDDTDDFVLYTDCDTMFLGACDFTNIRPAYLAAAPEISGPGEAPPSDTQKFNSGVMILNVKRFNNQRDIAMKILEDRHYFFRGRPGFYDQGLFNILFAHSWEPLDFLWNWRSYWKPRDDIKILHYHGPKPIQVQRHLAGGDPNALPHITKMINDNLESYRFYESTIAALHLDTGES